MTDEPKSNLLAAQAASVGTSGGSAAAAPATTAPAEVELAAVVRGGGGFGRKLVLSSFLGVALFVAFSFYADAGTLKAHLLRLPVPFILGALGLALANYLLRFAKWAYYLRHLRIRVPLPTSFLIFLSGLVMSVTPAKLGELLKAYLVQEACGHPMAPVAPVVIAERLTDLIALVLLTLMGVWAFRFGGTLVIAGAVLTALGTLIFSTPQLARPLINLSGRISPRVQHKLTDAYESMRELVRPAPLVVGTLLSVAAWFAECLAFYVIILGFSEGVVSLRLATFVYAATTIAGALSFLPGGLGVTESSMVFLLVKLASGVGRATAVAATLVIRLCTLWFAVVVGMVALALLRRRLGTRATT